MSTLTTTQAKRFYDRFGAKQDAQSFYEAPATDFLLTHGDFANARSVFEIGCGTGRLALELLSNHLPPTSTYRGVDISSTMVTLAAEKLAAFAPRATVSLEPGNTSLPCASQSMDRFLATYVFDLLPAREISRLLDEAHRILQPEGLLCLAGITQGTTFLSRIVMKIWQGLFRISPSAVGGCRPLRITEYLDHDCWRIKQHKTVVAYGIASEVAIARRI